MSFKCCCQPLCSCAVQEAPRLLCAVAKRTTVQLLFALLVYVQHSLLPQSSPTLHVRMLVEALLGCACAGFPIFGSFAYMQFSTVAMPCRHFSHTLSLLLRAPCHTTCNTQQRTTVLVCPHIRVTEFSPSFWH